MLNARTAPLFAPRFAPDAGVAVPAKDGVATPLSELSLRAPASPATVLRLADVPLNVPMRVVSIEAERPGQDLELILRLIEIGFVPGETVRVVAVGRPGREPVAVRLGGTTFALRRFEANCIKVTAALSAVAAIVAGQDGVM